MTLTPATLSNWRRAWMVLTPTMTTTPATGPETPSVPADPRSTKGDEAATTIAPVGMLVCGEVFR